MKILVGVFSNLMAFLAMHNMNTVPVLQYYGDFANCLLGVTDNIMKRGENFALGTGNARL